MNGNNSRVKHACDVNFVCVPVTRTDFKSGFGWVVCFSVCFLSED